MQTVVMDIPRIYTALAEWSACLIFLSLAPQRLSKPRTAAACVIALVIESIFLMATWQVAVFLWIPCMVVAFFMMVGFIYACCDIRPLTATYCALLAFVTAEFNASLEWQITKFFWGDDALPPVWVQLLLIAGIYGTVDFIIFRLLLAHVKRRSQFAMEYKDFCSAAIIGVAVFAVSNLGFYSKNTPFSGQYMAEIANIRTLVDLGGIAMLYAHLIHCVELHTRQELEAVESVLQNQYQQYKQSRESIELINYKYHDLKHQIEFLRHEQDADKRNEFLNRMEEEIKQYELQNKTGNSVLDTVLTGKSLYCNKHGITLTAVCDGALLEFMDTMDICSIFGNALDNAIECELKIPDKQKRLVHVTVAQQKNFVRIGVENYFEGNLSYDDTENLATTKKKKEFHGYGIKSIRYTVNKYGGAVIINNKNNWFDLEILIPKSGGL